MVFPETESTASFTHRPERDEVDIGGRGEKVKGVRRIKRERVSERV